MEKKKSRNLLLVIMGVLIVAEIVVRIIVIQTNTLIGVVQLISLLFIALYGFWLYKKPHGNMLKYAMLIVALASILASSKALMEGKSYHIVKLVASAAVCYCAGRLNRIDQNKYLMPIIGLAFLGVSVYATCMGIVNQMDFNWTILATFSTTIKYITLMIAYFVRFEEHKLAGIMDVPKQ